MTLRLTLLPWTQNSRIRKHTKDNIRIQAHGSKSHLRNGPIWIVPVDCVFLRIWLGRLCVMKFTNHGWPRQRNRNKPPVENTLFLYFESCSKIIMTRIRVAEKPDSQSQHFGKEPRTIICPHSASPVRNLAAKNPKS